MTSNGNVLQIKNVCIMTILRCVNLITENHIHAIRAQKWECIIFTILCYAIMWNRSSYIKLLSTEDYILKVTHFQFYSLKYEPLTNFIEIKDNNYMLLSNQPKMNISNNFHLCYGLHSVEMFAKIYYIRMILLIFDVNFIRNSFSQIFMPVKLKLKCDVRIENRLIRLNRLMFAKMF